MRRARVYTTRWSSDEIIGDLLRRVVDSYAIDARGTDAERRDAAAWIVAKIKLIEESRGAA